MFTNDKSIENIQQLIVELKKYLSLQKKYARLEITEKLTVLLSMLILILIVIILGMVGMSVGISRGASPGRILASALRHGYWPVNNA